MSFSSRRRNYLLTPHRRDGLIEWMKSMLIHSFVLDALETTGADTFSHFEVLIEEHKDRIDSGGPTSRLKQLVPTVGNFHTYLPLRQAFLAYNEKHHLTRRRHITISFNEIRHILNLAQIMALAEDPVDKQEDDKDALKSIEKEEGSSSGSTNLNFIGPKLITFDGDQTLYSDGANFESNRRLANYLYLLLKHGVTIAVVTAAGYEYNTEKYEYRLSGLLAYFAKQNLSAEDCSRFYLFGGECNYLLSLGSDYKLHPVKEIGPGGWVTSTKYIPEAPGNWNEEDVTKLLDLAEVSLSGTVDELRIKGRVIRKKRSVGLIPISPISPIPRECLDEAVLRVQYELDHIAGITLPFCAFNGGRDVWVDVGNKRVGVDVLQSYTGIRKNETLHIGDQFLYTGNDFAARAVCPCIWITDPEETTYILKSVLRLAKLSIVDDDQEETIEPEQEIFSKVNNDSGSVNFSECHRRAESIKKMNVFTGEMIVQENK